MAGAIPGHVTVERRRDGLFSTTSHVIKVAIDPVPRNDWPKRILMGRLWSAPSV
jgi:hypothetical protein